MVARPWIYASWRTFWPQTQVHRVSVGIVRGGGGTPQSDAVQAGVIYGGRRTFWPQGIMGTAVGLERREGLSRAPAAKPCDPFLPLVTGLQGRGLGLLSCLRNNGRELV